MAAPDLTGRTISATYKDLLQVSNSNAGVDGTSRAVQDGAGDVSAMELSTTGVKSTGTLDVTGNTTLSGNLTLGTTTTVSAVKDEDDLGGGSSSSSSLATQQSIKAYVDDQVAGKDHLSELAGDSDDVSEGSTNRYVTTDQEDALAGTNGTPNSTNPFVTNTDSRLTDSRNPDGSAGGDLSGTYPDPTVAKLQGRDMASTAPSDGQVIKWNNSSSQWEPAADSTGSGGGGGLDNVSEDTTPQLGGNLDVNTYSLVSVSNGNIPIAPDGSGKVVLDGLNWPTADGSDGDVLQTDGAGNLSFSAGGGGSGDITGVTITTDSGAGSKAEDAEGSADFSLLGSAGVGVTNSGTTITVAGTAASDAAAGVVELATGTETNTGTDATRAVTPDGLDDWTGSAQVTTLGTVSTGTWQGDAIAGTYIGSHSHSYAAQGTNDDITSLTGLTTALSVTQGGTGLSAITTGHVLYASDADTIAAAAPGSASGVQAYDADTAKTDTAQTFTAPQRGTVDPATAGVCDLSEANNHSVAVSGATQVSVSNATAGQSGIITITHDGSTVITFSGFKWESGTVPTPSTTGVDLIAYYCESASRVSAAYLKAMA